MAICPVCDMTVDEKAAPARTTYQGQTYYFCSNECKAQFEKQPERFVPEAMPSRP